MRRIHWKWIVIASFFAEATVFAVFFLLLFAATVAGVPEIARPMSTLDYIDALVSSFAVVFLSHEFRPMADSPGLRASRCGFVAREEEELWTIS